LALGFGRLTGGIIYSGEFEGAVVDPSFCMCLSHWLPVAWAQEAKMPFVPAVTGVVLLCWPLRKINEKTFLCGISVFCLCHYLCRSTDLAQGYYRLCRCRGRAPLLRGVWLRFCGHPAARWLAALGCMG